MRWPAHAATIRLAARNANKVRKAFKSVLHGDEIARQWAETHPAGGSVSPQMARDWAQVHITADKRPMQNALARIYAEGYVTGEYAANYMLARLQGLRKAQRKQAPAVTAGVVDWATWKPGARAAAALVRPKGGLENLLATRRISIADEVMHTKLDRIGTALAKGLENGWAVREVAKALDTIIDDPQQALVIAQTEMSRAVSVATRDRYESAGVQQVEWLVAEGCDDCQDNADASPIDIGDTFPSGDSEPPAHPNCMCALAAYMDSEGDTVEGDIELAVVADTGKILPTDIQLERVLARFALNEKDK